MLFSPAASPHSHGVKPDEFTASTPIFSYSHKSRVDLLAISPDGAILATESTLDGLIISDLCTGKLLRTWREPGFSANSLAFSYDGTILGTGNNDGRVRLWDTHTGVLLKKLPVCQWSIYAIAFSPDGQTLASCAGDGTVQLWNIRTGERLMTLGKKGERMSSMAFSPDGKLLATLSRYVRADVWDVFSGRLINTLAGKGVSFDALCSVSFCSGGKIVSVACEGDICLWNPLKKDEPEKVRIPDSIDPLKRLDTRMPTGSVNRRIFIGMTVLSPDCDRAATVNVDGSIAVWDVATREVRQILAGARIPDLAGGGVEAMAFSPDGKIVASANRNGKVEVWQIRLE